MKREIIFRGRKVDTKEWVYGYLVKIQDKSRTGHAIKNTVYHVNSGYINLIPVEVIPETVGQYTGLKDKNGKMVFEGDIIDGCNGSMNDYEWRIGAFAIEFKDGKFNVPAWSFDSTHYFEVIGNIHENPELLCTQSSR